MYKIIVFDLDDTLTRSVQKADEEMIWLFEKLSCKYMVSVLTWWDFTQICKQIINHLNKDNSNFNDIFLFPANWTRMMSFEDWKFLIKYSENFTKQEVELVEIILNKTIEKLNLKPEKQYWDLIINKWWQITYSSLWKDVPLDIKEAWDPDSKKRLKIIDYIKNDLKDFDVLAAGRTSIDIIRKWRNKSYGIKKIISEIWVKKEEILFIWDMLMPGWNDYPVLEFWVNCKSVKNPEDTKIIINELIK